MAGGYLITCTPSKAKRTRSIDDKPRTRLLRGERAAAGFVEQYIDPADPFPQIRVQVFNSNGYPEQTLQGRPAVDYFKDQS